MALQKSKVLSNGQSGNYWKIISLTVDRAQNLLSCRLGLFTSQEFRHTEPIGEIKGFSSYHSSLELCGNLIELMYIDIKASGDPDLAGCEDV